jgi:hypothetical protein
MAFQKGKKKNFQEMNDKKKPGAPVMNAAHKPKKKK